MTHSEARETHAAQVYLRVSGAYYHLCRNPLTVDEIFAMSSSLRMAAYGLFPQAGKLVRHFPAVARAWRAALRMR